MATPLVIGPDEETKFAALKNYAASHVIDMAEVMPMIQTKKGKRKHLERMNKYTIALPFGFTVTYSVEIGHPIGSCRHLSMASAVPRRVPSPQAVWMVAEYFDFKGGLEACTVWPEELGDGGTAINVVQPLKVN